MVSGASGANAPPVYFVADLHLAGVRPRAIDVFTRFLAGTARSAQALYILGDLFEYWIGDDDSIDPSSETVLLAIADLTRMNVPVYFVPGNRDFLLGNLAAARAKLTLLPDPTVITLFGRRVLLAHGDAYCTGDAAYQAYRRFVRSAWFRSGIRLFPPGVRHSLARSLRRKSERDKSVKPAAIMDVEPGAIDSALRASGCALMIHGHTHRPARHEHFVDGLPCERWVLADWYESGSYLRVDAHGVTAHPLS